uniref:Uncharacterized protein n=1 Tax=Acrobeloides nanus TaxID=290746 RepID=A0A914DB58_9BILA
MFEDLEEVEIQMPTVSATMGTPIATHQMLQYSRIWHDDFTYWVDPTYKEAKNVCYGRTNEEGQTRPNKLQNTLIATQIDSQKLDNRMKMFALLKLETTYGLNQIVLLDEVVF